MVRRQGFASLPQLAAELGVSESTVRRDLDQLEESGAAQRIHGGVCYTGPSPKLTHFDQIQSRNWEKKRQIAQRAAELIEEGDTILLDGGSTTYELAQLLVGRTLQVVTNSLPVANLFVSSDSADLIFVGGYVHSKSGVSLGPYATDMLRHLTGRRAVLSVGGVQEQGLFNSNLLLVETERAMMQAADEVIILADSTKFGHSSLARLCDLEQIDAMVVDTGIDAVWKQRLRDANVRLYVAGDV
ncbi:MAG: DeoR/GlpR transcriptional regulator [Planctomycetales bacterium]|nr:DeoR/GlpR transcriptional regulator [Planctomycetales bacterium]